MSRARKVHRRRLKYLMNDIAYLMFFVFLWSIAAMDSENMLVPMTAFLISGGWLLVHGMVRDAQREARERKYARCRY